MDKSFFSLYDALLSDVDESLAVKGVRPGAQGGAEKGGPVTARQMALQVLPRQQQAAHVPRRA